MKTRFEHSAGGVVFRRSEGGSDRFEIALASRRTRRGELVWGLPKGAVEEGERPDETAVREVREETGLIAEIREPLGDISYWYVWQGQRVRKRAPKIDRGAEPDAPPRRRRRAPTLPRLRRDEIPGIAPETRPYATEGAAKKYSRRPNLAKDSARQRRRPVFAPSA